MIERRAPDVLLLVVAALLTAIGIVMVFSASSAVAYTQYHDATYYLKRELLWAAIGIVALVIGMRMDYTKVRPLTLGVLIVALVLLAAVLVPGLGFIEGGARRWFALGPLTFEPSEFGKLALVLFLAGLFASRHDGAGSFPKAGFWALAAVGACFVLVMREPDLGTATLYLLTTFVMLFVAGAPLLQLALEVAIAVPALFAYITASHYRRERFLSFLHPWNDPKGTGYHIIQSLYALGSGGLFGLGLGQSRQKFGYLPAQHTDFIFAIIGEELGFVGAALVVLLFLVFAYRGIRIAMRAEDRFGFYLASGLTASIALQALMNIGVVTASWPVTGVPLPFISYGGTSLVVTLFSVGLLASVSRGQRRQAAALPARRRKVS
jgi:cell division protein FtsW